MKKNNFFEISLIALVTVLTVLLQFGPMAYADQPQRPTTIVLHHGNKHSTSDVTDGINTRFSIYDLTQQITAVGPQENKQEAFFESLGQKKPSEIQKYIVSNRLQKIGSLRTDSNGKSAAFNISSSIKAILIVQEGKSYNLEGQEISAQPLALSFPIVNENGLIESSVDIYTKSVQVPTPSKPEEPNQPNQLNQPGQPNSPKEPAHTNGPFEPTAPSKTGKVHQNDLLPTTGAIKRRTFFGGLILILISTSVIIILKRKKGEVLNEKK